MIIGAATAIGAIASCAPPPLGAGRDDDGQKMAKPVMKVYG